jgi:hypothetical protein
MRLFCCAVVSCRVVVRRAMLLAHLVTMTKRMTMTMRKMTRAMTQVRVEH